MRRWFKSFLILTLPVFLPIFTTPVKAAPISVTTEQLVIIGMPTTPFTPVSLTTEQLIILGMPATSFTPISVTTEELVIVGKP